MEILQNEKVISPINLNTKETIRFLELIPFLNVNKL